jgi:hypothetical protein
MESLPAPPPPSQEADLLSRIRSSLDSGRSAVAEAVPGAGKTRLITSLCDDGVPSLILAYNAELAERVTGSVDAASVTCLTFHALCCRCLRPARDDVELLSALDAVEAGHLTPSDVPDVRRVLIDEAQDVRDLYVRLVRAVGLVREGTSFLVAGDRNQLIYDFDSDFPATLRTLVLPHEALGVPAERWDAFSLPRSHRLTAPMARLVNHVFGTCISSDREGPVVEVRAPRGPHSDLYSLLSDVLDSSDVLLLVDRKSGNRPLRSLVNAASRRGARVHVHGVEDDKHCDENRRILRCGTFWSAKGLEAQTVVVLLPGRAPRNATYVALTRATERLIVVLDPREPHPSLCHAVRGSNDVVLRGGWAHTLVDRGCAEDSASSFGRRTWARQENSLRCLDTATPRVSSVPSVVSVFREEDEDPPGGEGGGGAGDGQRQGDAPSAHRGRVFVRMALLAAELAVTGDARAVRDLMHPTRIGYDCMSDAIRAGLASRTVPTATPDDALLAPDLRAVAARAFSACRSSPVDPPLPPLATLALSAMAWDGWDHVMRASPPVEGWADGASPVVGYVASVLPSGPTCRYDTRLVTAESHVRVHASCPDRAYHVVWGATSSDVASAAVRAAAHPKGECLLVDAALKRVTEVRARADFLSQIE